MIVINLFGGAGAGKTTMAANLFSRLRFDNKYKCELVPEFAKEVVHEGGHKNLGDQFYLLGNQQHRLWRLKRLGIDVAICDGPLQMAPCYTAVHRPETLELMKEVVTELDLGYTNLNFFVERPVGGNFRKDKNWSHDIDKKIKEMVVLHFTLKFSPEGADKLYMLVKKYLEESIG